MKTRKFLTGMMAALLAVVAGAAALADTAYAQNPTPTPTSTPMPTPVLSVPPIPMILGGEAVGAPDGFNLVARIGGYETLPATIENGRYLLKVSPPSSAFLDEEVRIFLEGVEANERARHNPGTSNLRFTLTFPHIPEATLTPTPVPVLPSTYSGNIVVAGFQVTPDMVLVARVGDYQTAPAAILDRGNFINLVIIPIDKSVIGLPVEFFLNGEPSTPPAHGIFEPDTQKNVSLVFERVPPTATPVPPTATPIPPTATPVPPTSTPVPPTSTPVPPTATPVPPTATPVPPTATPVPPTATPVPPTATPEPPPPTQAPPTAVVVEPEPEENGGGACSAASRGLPFGEAAGNALMLFAPLALLGGAKHARSRRRKKAASGERG